MSRIAISLVRKLVLSSRFPAQFIGKYLGPKSRDFPAAAAAAITYLRQKMLELKLIVIL